MSTEQLTVGHDADGNETIWYGDRPVSQRVLAQSKDGWDMLARLVEQGDRYAAGYAAAEQHNRRRIFALEDELSDLHARLEGMA